MSQVRESAPSRTPAIGKIEKHLIECMMVSEYGPRATAEGFEPYGTTFNSGARDWGLVCGMAYTLLRVHCPNMPPAERAQAARALACRAWRYVRPPRRVVGGNPLSTRQQEVLARVYGGSHYKQIAADLGLGVSTVRTHIQHALAKLEVPSSALAAVQAVRLGYLDRVIDQMEGDPDAAAPLPEAVAA